MLHTETSSVSPGATVNVHTDEGTDTVTPLLMSMLGNQKSGIDPAMLSLISGNKDQGAIGGSNGLMMILLLLFLGKGGLGGLGGSGDAAAVATARDVASFQQWATANSAQLSSQIAAISPQLCASTRDIIDQVTGVNTAVLTTSCQTLRDMAVGNAALTQTIFQEGARGRELNSEQHASVELNATNRFHEIQQSQAAIAAASVLQASNVAAASQLQICNLQSSLQAQIAECCCESKIQGLENTQKILDNAANNTANIMSALNAQNTAALNLQIGNQATTIAQLNTEKTISAALSAAFARYPAPVCNGGHHGS
jgi:hypothetical protein